MENTDENKPKKKKKLLPLILSAILLTGIFIGVQKYLYARHYEDTDDAQIEGTISPVMARVGGYVDSIYFEDNQKVSKGQLLVKLDDNDLKIKVRQAEAALENAKANVQAISAGSISTSSVIESSKANIEAAKARAEKAEKDLSRFEKLLADHAVTQQQYDAVKAERDIAAAQLDAANKQTQTVKESAIAGNEQVSVAQAMVKQKQADLDFANLQLSYAYIKAPSTGIVSRKNIQPGQLVQPGQALFAVVSDSDVWVVANFKETQLSEIKPGDEVEVQVDAFGKEKFHAEVSSFSPATGAKFSLLPPDNATGNFVKVVQRVPVKIVFKESSETKSRLKPGMSVRVAVKLS